MGEAVNSAALSRPNVHATEVPARYEHVVAEGAAASPRSRGTALEPGCRPDVASPSSTPLRAQRCAAPVTGGGHVWSCRRVRASFRSAAVARPAPSCPRRRNSMRRRASTSRGGAARADAAGGAADRWKGLPALAAGGRNRAAAARSCRRRVWRHRAEASEFPSAFAALGGLNYKTVGARGGRPRRVAAGREARETAQDV